MNKSYCRGKSHLYALKLAVLYSQGLFVPVCSMENSSQDQEKTARNPATSTIFIESSILAQAVMMEEEKSALTMPDKKAVNAKAAFTSRR